MILNIKVIPVLAFVVASSLAGAVYAGEQESGQVNRALNYYCAKKEVSTEESVVIGQSTQVNLKSGSFYLVESDSTYQATLDLVSQEAVRMGVSRDCSEYLLSKGRLQGYEQGNVIARVFFDFDKYHLSKDSRYILQSVADKLKQDSSELILEGHTDSIGTKAYNFTLGLKRSEAVKAYLAEKGVSTDDMVAVSRGEGHPIASNKTAEGRRQNRRVDMISE
ncbi:OmpA family protein [Vibrio albus]|uniref:OmpA family protein n=1 Tax=Vibrio albus TaxID=2200953 RepID=A0A2U3BEN0_9VIBR|nr:OmpA family protein [Vibrio albus]PWI35214.1 OmpA family protein [Vibrio albus]